MISTKRKNYDNMTRYRQRTRKMLIRYLFEGGPSPISELARELERDERVIRNYLRHFSEDFAVTGLGSGARWRTLSMIGKNEKIMPRVDLPD